MREIKFSCMWKDGDSWIDNRHSLGDMENGDHWEAMSDNPMLRGYILKHKRQYTGLTGKNGVEIYEGDIISDHNGFGIVAWEEGCAGFKVSYVGIMKGYGKWFADYNINGEFESIEVEGNIHENPELIK